MHFGWEETENVVSFEVKARQCFLCLPCSLIHTANYTWGGGEGVLKKLARGGSALRSEPLPFYVSFLAEKVPLSYTFHWRIMKGSFKYLNDSFPYPFIYLKHEKATPFGRSLPV